MTLVDTPTAAPPQPVLLHRATAWVGPDGTPVPSPRELLVEVLDVTEPIGFARKVSALVNNTAVALLEVRSPLRRVYPVADPRPEGAGEEPRLLTFRMRNVTRAVDEAVQEQVVSLVSSAYRVVAVRSGR